MNRRYRLERERPVVSFLAAGTRFASAEMRAGLLIGDPRADAVLTVAVIEAAGVLGLAGNVPGQVRMPGLELAKGKTAEAAELPVDGKADLVQQAKTARLADPVRDVPERIGIADD